MKKLFTVIALLVLGATTSFAQLGVRAGLNFNNIGKDAKDDLNIENKTGFHVGLVYNIDLIFNLGIEPGLYFSQKGFKLLDEDANMNYLEVPVNVKYNIIDLSILNLDAHIGPFVAYGLGGKWDDIKVFDKDEGDFNRFDFGLQMGLGVKLIKKIYAGVNYDLSLTKINEEDGITKDNLKEKNHVWLISVGLNF